MHIGTVLLLVGLRRSFVSGLYSLNQYWYPVAPYGADIDE
jgi:hypothetical protein